MKKYSTGELGKEEMEIVHVSCMDIQLKDVNLSSNSFIAYFSSSIFNSICIHLSTKCGNEISSSSHSFSSFPRLSFLLDYHSALSHPGCSSLRPCGPENTVLFLDGFPFLSGNSHAEISATTGVLSFPTTFYSVSCITSPLHQPVS